MTTSGKTSGIHTFKDRIPEDVELLTSVGLGDERAMALLYDRHSPLVYSVALRVCHDSASAEAIVQDIFMQMWLAPQKFDPASGSLDGRLAILSRNLAIDLLRRDESSESSGLPPFSAYK